MMRWNRLFAAAAIFACGTASAAFGQTIMRFETNVGSFDMVLNPNNDANLQPLVDNLVAYVGLGRYHFSAINRAADGNPGTSDDFVLQMGSFLAFPPVPDLWAAEGPTAIDRFAAVTTDADGNGQVDFSAISNQRGTVSLALSSGGPNTGTSSFFVNLGDNNFLDSQGFVPFARIENMGTIDKILQLQQQDLSNAAGDPGGLTFSDVPVTSEGRLVFVQRVTVAQSPADFSFIGPIASALQLARRGSGTPLFDGQATAAALAASDAAAAESLAAALAAASASASRVASASRHVCSASTSAVSRSRRAAARMSSIACFDCSS